jgi:glutamate-1-semialdehyde 2,1-aminomutase
MELYAKARGHFPSGVTHDSRFLSPFPVFIERALGPHKWSVEGHRLVDLAMGHGALLLGHADPEMVAAVQEQVAKGTHYAGNHVLEMEWAGLISELMPAAERVRFTASGTEATMMALRLARSHTGRSKIIKFQGHFHGWHDYATAGVTPPWETPTSTGIPPAILDTIVVVSPSDPDAVTRVLETDNDIAGIILEPNGGAWGTIPFPAGYLQTLRDLATKHGVVLIFDEVVTGFRMAPGGAQEYYGVRADLIALAKIVAGGLPGGAVAGRAEIVDRIGFRDDPRFNRYEKVAHPGTFNANPVSAVAGISALRKIRGGEPNRKAAAAAERLIRDFNQVLDDEKVTGCVYGEGSMLHITLGTPCDRRGGCDFRCQAGIEQLSGSKGAAYLGPLRKAMLVEGVDIFGNGAILSSTHEPEDLDLAVRAFALGVRALRAEGYVK